MPRLAVVILTWNGRDDTLACLSALRDEIGDNDTVIVCDNGSRDGTEDAVRSVHPWVDFIQNGTNLGFAGGNNVGLRSALDRGFEWVLLLNNDTTVPVGTVAALLAHATSRATVGAFQPLLLAADNRRIDSAGHLAFRRTGVEDALMGCPVDAAPRLPTPVLGACAAAALLRAAVLRESGLFDEDFFVIAEDVDLMFRIRLAGHDVELVPHIRVVHKRGISGGSESTEAMRRRRFWIDRNTVALALRYWPTRYLVAASPLIAIRLVRAMHGMRHVRGHRCVPLWSRSLSARAANRRGMRSLGLDRWFRVRPSTGSAR